MTAVKIKMHDPALAGQIPIGPARPGDAGVDMCNASGKVITVLPGESKNIPAGISVKIPEGYVGIICPRSSTFARRGLMVVNGIIDSGYTGPLYSFVWHPTLNGVQHPVLVEPFERLAQLVVVPSFCCGYVQVDELPKTERGGRGFGSTGT